MAYLIEILKEQESIAFTGRISIYGSLNSEYLGYILIKDGMIILVNFDKLRDLEAIYKITCLETLDSKIFRFETSPENVESFNKRIYYSFSEIKNLAEKELDEMVKIRKLKPPMNITLAINNQFIKQGANIFKREFEVLCLINSKKTVASIYKSCKFDENSITKSLISLRKLKAIKVISKKK